MFGVDNSTLQLAKLSLPSFAHDIVALVASTSLASSTSRLKQRVQEARCPKQADATQFRLPGRTLGCLDGATDMMLRLLSYTHQNGRTTVSSSVVRCLHGMALNAVDPWPCSPKNRPLYFFHGTRGDTNLLSAPAVRQDPRATPHVYFLRLPPLDQVECRCLASSLQMFSTAHGSVL